MENGEVPIIIRITINGVHDEARIQRSLPVNLWNQAKGCSKGKDRNSLEINNFIDALKTKAHHLHKELLLEEAHIPPLLPTPMPFQTDDAQNHEIPYRGYGETGRHRLRESNAQPILELLSKCRKVRAGVLSERGYCVSGAFQAIYPAP